MKEHKTSIKKIELLTNKHLKILYFGLIIKTNKNNYSG